MPKRKPRKRTRPPAEARRAEPPPGDLCAMIDGLMRGVTLFFQGPRSPAGEGERCLRSATVEVLEAMRAVLDVTIAWLREEKGGPEMKRIRVED